MTKQCLSEKKGLVFTMCQPKIYDHVHRFSPSIKRQIDPSGFSGELLAWSPSAGQEYHAQESHLDLFSGSQTKEVLFCSSHLRPH